MLPIPQELSRKGGGLIVVSLIPSSSICEAIGGFLSVKRGIECLLLRDFPLPPWSWVWELWARGLGSARTGGEHQSAGL